MIRIVGKVMRKFAPSRVGRFGIGLTMSPALFAFFIGCGEASFTGAGVAKKAAPVLLQSRDQASNAIKLRSTCDSRSVTVPASESDQLRVSLEGEFCAQDTSDLQVVFVLDFSESMRSNDPAYNAFAGGGSPSCGRALAVSQVTQMIKSAGGDQVSVSMVGFGGGAVELLTETPINSFQPLASDLCRNDLLATNYKAAFNEATRVMQSSTKTNKVLYFISDGLPSRGGAVLRTANLQGHRNAGKRAAQNMRNALPDLTFNAILLEPMSGIGFGIDSRSYLSELTGDPSRVRVVSQAAALADSAVELLNGQVHMNPSTVSASLQGALQSSQNVIISSFIPSNGLKSSAVAATFTTSEFTLPAAEPGSYSLRVEGRSLAGELKSTTVSITVE